MRAKSKKGGASKAKVAKRQPQAGMNPIGKASPKATHASHRHAQHPRAAAGFNSLGGSSGKGARKSTRRKLAGLMPYDGCAVQAVADSLMLATGLRASDAELEALFAVAGGHPEHGAVLADVLAVATLMPLAGLPRLAAFVPADPLADSGSLLLGLDLTAAQADQGEWDAQDAPGWGPHAVAAFPGGVLSWGREIPVTRRFLALAREAWTVEWRT